MNLKPQLKEHPEGNVLNMVWGGVGGWDERQEDRRKKTSRVKVIG